MDNKKKLTIILAIFAVVCAFAVLVFSGVLDEVISPSDEPTTDAEPVNHGSDYNVDLIAKGDSNLPYLETDIDNVFYTMSTDGAVNFYKYEDNTFFPLEATGTYDAKVKLSEQNVNATITYYEQDGVISGYGLYTGSTTEFDLYPYAFFRLTNYGEDYAKKSSKSCLLLIDTTEEDFYSNEKIFEEPFIFKYDDSTCSRQLSEANRTVGINGARRTDYSLVNDNTVNGSVDTVLFFSGRQYGEDDPRVDLLSSGGSGNNTDNINLAKDVLGYFATYTEDGIIYITTENNNVVVEKSDKKGNNAQIVKSFEGVTKDDILVCHDCIYVKSTNTVYDISEDKETKISFTGSENFRADLFVCEDNRIVVRGYSEERYPVLCVADSLTGEVSAVYSDELFRDVVNPIFADDSLILTVQKNGTFTYYIF
ncbi:MAG: hypothetical protein IKW03_05900 [Clostridia bacterium]|nr:hypothetical protein [Clostridia bacterium]